MDGTVLLVYSSDPLSVCGFAIDGWYGLGKNQKKKKEKTRDVRVIHSTVPRESDP